jgi:hypothetical protein
VIPPVDADSEETHKLRHCLTFTFNGDFSVEPERRVAFTGPMCPPSVRLATVEDGPWFTVLGGRVRPGPLSSRASHDPEDSDGTGDMHVSRWPGAVYCAVV